MPLQIRRGTDAERLAMTVPLAQGELLYITNQQKIYVGDGATLAGALSPVTGYTNDDARDSAASIFTGGSHSGIGFTYNTATDIITATVDLSDYTGTIKASSFKGTIVADDSTELVNAVDGTFNLDGTVRGNVVPDNTGLYDIGSNSTRFKDLYLSGSTIRLNTATITAVGSAINLPAGSTINGVVIASGDGVVPGSNYKINIVGEDSSVIVNSATGQLTGNLTGNVIGNTSGFHTGDIKGSVFGNDSSFIVDANSNTINIQTITHTSGELRIGDELNTTSLFVTSNAALPLAVKGITDGTGGPRISIVASKGTLTSPAALVAGDEVGGFGIQITDGTTFKNTASLLNQIASDAVMSDANPKSDLFIGVSAGGTSFSAYTFKGDGTFVAPGAIQLAAYANDAARSAAIPVPAQGMMVFMQSGTAPSVTNKTVVYDGTAWVALH
jgi:hypothetical protein